MDPAEAASNVISERKDKSRLHLSQYVTDASQNAAASDGDLNISRHVKDVAAIHSTIWPEEEAEKHTGVLAPLSVYSQQTVIAIVGKTIDSESTALPSGEQPG